MTLDVLEEAGLLEEALARMGQPGFRARQIRDWVFTQGLLDPGRMTNLPADLRKELQVGSLRELSRLDSRDGTIKILLERREGEPLETVGIPMEQDTAWTVCVSSQTGCAMGCVFCATGTLPSPKNLSGAQIVEQVLRQWRAAGEKPSRIVFMGMGEPLANRPGVGTALDLLTGPMGLSGRRITVSTVGLIDGIRWLAEHPARVNLAVSLHSAVDETRRKLVPAVDTSLDEIETSARHYRETTGRDVTYEIVLLGGLNDDAEHARALARRAGHGITVNLIPYNPGGAGDWQAPSRTAVQSFKGILESRNVACTVRRQRGSDIQAACGELAAKN